MGRLVAYILAKIVDSCALTHFGKSLALKKGCRTHKGLVAALGVTHHSDGVIVELVGLGLSIGKVAQISDSRSVKVSYAVNTKSEGSVYGRNALARIACKVTVMVVSRHGNVLEIEGSRGITVKCKSDGMRSLGVGVSAGKVFQ